MAFDQFRGRLIAPSSVAADVNGCVSQVFRWARDGRIKVVKLGARMTRIDGDSLADFLSSRMDAPRPPRGRNLSSEVAK